MLYTRSDLRNIIIENLEGRSGDPGMIVTAVSKTRTVYIHSMKILEEFTRLLSGDTTGYGQYFESVCYTAIPKIMKGYNFTDLNTIKNQPFADALETSGNILYSIKFSQKLASDRLEGIDYSLIPQCMTVAKNALGGLNGHYTPGLIKGNIATADYLSSNAFKNLGCLPITIGVIKGNKSPRYSLDSNDNLSVLFPFSKAEAQPNETQLLDKLYGAGNWENVEIKRTRFGSEKIYGLKTGDATEYYVKRNGVFLKATYENGKTIVEGD